MVLNIRELRTTTVVVASAGAETAAAEFCAGYCAVWQAVCTHQVPEGPKVEAEGGGFVDLYATVSKEYPVGDFDRKGWVVVCTATQIEYLTPPVAELVGTVVECPASLQVVDTEPALVEALHVVVDLLRAAQRSSPMAVMATLQPKGSAKAVSSRERSLSHPFFSFMVSIK